MERGRENVLQVLSSLRNLRLHQQQDRPEARTVVAGGGGSDLMWERGGGRDVHRIFVQHTPTKIVDKVYLNATPPPLQPTALTARPRKVDGCVGLVVSVSSHESAGGAATFAGGWPD